MSKIIGIDLGTTNSVVAVMEGGEPKVIPNEEGGRTTPSVVGFTKTGERLVGQVAKRQAITNPENTAYSIKRFMGRRFNEVSEEMKMVPYKVVKSGDHVAVVAEGKEYEGLDLRSKGNEMALQRLRDAAERAKIELSTTMETEINLPFITADASGPKHLVKKLTRAKLESMVEDIIQRSVGPCKQCMKDAGIDPSKINEVVLVGGQIRMPRIQGLVKELFGKEGHKGVNPDEVVAVGAAIQGGVLKGEVKDLLLLDVTPLTLSIETLGGVATPMIPRNTSIPTRKTETFSTAADSQTSVEVHVLQGERPMAAQNRTLGKFHLTGIPPAPRGMPQIEVTFDIDANGILNVMAKDTATQKDQKITITSSSGLSKEEVERMAKDAEAHSAEDKTQRETIDAKNQLDSLVYQIEKMLREQGDKISGSDRGDVENAIADAKKALESNDKGQMDKARETLTAASHKLAEQMYKSAQAQTPPAGGAAPGTGTG